ncbi:MAG TPA: MBL fold metallo-hydrolase [Vicinamibacterales bacterium]|nr:MBL fold metallo-hydrolase [Vicinamibacterales bacterium]
MSTRLPRAAGIDRRGFLGLLAAAAAVRATSVHAAPGPSRSRLILLGTAGGPTPKKTRSAPAQALVIGDRTYVIDCGNGVARQLVLAGIPLTSIREVFITHHHSDHNADYGNLLLLAWGDALTTRVDTWGPPPLERITKLFFEMSAPDLEVREKDEGRPPLPPLVHPHEITRAGLVMRDDRVKVTCAIVQHPLVPLAFAYRFDCPDRSIVFSGDTRPSPALVALAKGADVLVHEALYVPDAPGTPGSALRRHIMASHTSAEDAGRIAAEAGVRTLVLSHFVPSETPMVTDEQWLAAARTHFRGRIVVGRDLLDV